MSVYLTTDFYYDASYYYLLTLISDTVSTFLDSRLADMMRAPAPDAVIIDGPTITIDSTKTYRVDVFYPLLLINLSKMEQH